MKNEIRALRKVELTKIELSEKSGVSLPTIRRAEAGEVISVPVLVKLAKALKCTLNDLIPCTDYQEQAS